MNNYVFLFIFNSIFSKKIFCRHICDGKWQCPEGEDEASCDFYNCSGLFLCSKMERKVCLHPTSFCDGFNDCLSQEDEYLCELDGTCPINCQCLMYAVKCTNNTLVQTLKTNLGLFSHCVYLKVINITGFHSNSYMSINNNTLVVFVWCYSHLTDICSYVNYSASQMQLLDLGFNEAQKLFSYCFHKKRNLKIVLLNNNKLTNIQQYSFSGLQRLMKLDLSSNNLKRLSHIIFADLSLYLLNITNNSFEYIDEGLVRNLKTSIISTDDYRICCLLKSSDVLCSVTPKWPYDCETLLKSSAMKVVIISVTVINISLNVFAFCVKVAELKKKKKKKKSFSHGDQNNGFLVNNLLLITNDCLYGFYLLFMLYKDQDYGNTFTIYAKQWLDAAACKVLALYNTFVLINSIFLLLLLSISRLVVVKYPFNTTVKRSSKILTYSGIGAMGIFLFCLAGLFIYLFIETKNIMPSPMCLLFGETITSVTIKIMTISMIILELAAIITIIGTYTVMVRELKKSRDQLSQKSNKSKPALVQTVLIVTSTSLCWLPSGAIHMTSIILKPYPIDLLFWNAILISPLNTVMNPIIFSVIPFLKSCLKKDKETKTN